MSDLAREAATGATPAPAALTAPAAPPAGRVGIDGKQFSVAGQRFRFRGVTYGTFRPRQPDGERFPEPERAEADLAAMARAGFTVVRTYTAPPEDLVSGAARHGLRLLAGVFYPDWRYLLGGSRRDRARVVREAREEVRAVARRLAGRDEVLALCLGNEIPADVVRWYGAERLAAALADLAEVAREEDPDHLVTYANYPTAEYLPLEEMDFLTFNVYLESRAEYRKYLTRLQNLAGDRPLVLGEVGTSAGPGPRGEREQAEALDWQLEAAVERGVAGTCVFSWTDEWWVGDGPVEGWRFGLTDVGRTPRPALAVAEKWNAQDVRHLDVAWPSMSVVICAHDEQATIDEAVRHACALDYPDLEVIVVDDGSTDATAEIARRHERARVVSIEHSGLSVARNVGIELATGELVAFLDADAYPSPEWPYFLALGLDGPTVGGVGGPNLPPVTDGLGAQKVARSPGGPVHVLLGDDRAEHVPGCNMAFWRSALLEVGGFDPVYTAAGDDVDVCWKVLDRGWDIAFHPAALVWHHRRTGLRRYLRQQRGYGRAEALVEARHPDRFSPLGGARWRGRIYSSLTPPLRHHRVYRGIYGSAPYQSVYQGGGGSLDVLHQGGVPVAALLLLTAPLAVISPALGLPALAAVAFLAVLGLVDALGTVPPRHLSRGRLRFRAAVALHHLLQPLARTWGRRRHREAARRGAPGPAPIPGPLKERGRTLLLPESRPRAEITAAVVDALRAEGYPVVQATGWEGHDAELVVSLLLRGRLVSSAHPPGVVQLRVRRRLRLGRLVALAALLAVGATVDIALDLAVAGLAAADLARGWWRTGPGFRRSIRRHVR